MKTIELFLFTALMLTTISCTDKDKIAAAIQGDKELADGSLVPFILHQNYPNPFNPSTMIEFVIYSTPIHARLTVMTEDWVEVKTLFDADIPVMPIDTIENNVVVPSMLKHSVHFNADNLPSGEYIYMMEAGGVKEVRRMRLIK